MVLVGTKLAEGSRWEYGLLVLVALNSFFKVFAYSFLCWILLNRTPTYFGFERCIVDISIATIAGKRSHLFKEYAFCLGFLVEIILSKPKGEDGIQRYLSRHI